MSEFKPIYLYPNYSISQDGDIKNQHGHFIKHHITNKGYHCVGLWNSSKMSLKRVHRLVLETFIGFCPSGHQAAHIDGNPHNNHISNLKWVTCQENHEHKKLHGTTATGIKHFRAKLTEQIVKEVLISPLTSSEASKHFNIDVSVIQKIRRGKAWNHIDRPQQPDRNYCRNKHLYEPETTFIDYRGRRTCLICVKKRRDEGKIVCSALLKAVKESEGKNG